MERGYVISTFFRSIMFGPKLKADNNLEQKNILSDIIFLMKKDWKNQKWEGSELFMKDLD